MRYLRTSDLARAVGVHPNTVRRYVERGILPPVERTPAGYRQFTEKHLDLLRLAWEVFGGQHPGAAIARSRARIVSNAVTGDLIGALDLARQHLALIRSERAHADLAADQLERWASAAPDEDESPSLTIGQVSKQLGVSIDIVRSWDRNGLIDVPRDPANGYRRYGASEMNRLRVIRTLSRAGYSIGSILRMMLQLDRGETSNLRHALDTPRAGEDAFLASDRWMSTLIEQDRRAHTIIALLEAMCDKDVSGDR